MKQRIARFGTIAAIVALTFVFGSCTWILGNFSSFEIDGDSYDISKLIIGDAGPQGSGDGILVFLLSEDMDVDASGNLTGNGDAIVFGVISDSNELESGDYDYSDSGAVETLVGGFAETGINVAAATSEQLVFFNGGTISIRAALDGSYVFNIEVDGIDVSSAASVDLTGYFRGRVDDEITTGSFSVMSVSPSAATAE